MKLYHPEVVCVKKNKSDLSLRSLCGQTPVRIKNWLDKRENLCIIESSAISSEVLCFVNKNKGIISYG